MKYVHIRCVSFLLGGRDLCCGEIAGKIAGKPRKPQIPHRTINGLGLQSTHISFEKRAEWAAMGLREKRRASRAVPYPNVVVIVVVGADA